MIDVTKPHNYDEMHDKEGGWCLIHRIPLPLFAWWSGYSLKYIHDCYFDGKEWVEFCYGDENLYTDYPAVAVKIEDYLYYISVSENPEILAEYPPEYKEQVEKSLAFVKQFHEIFRLHWHGKLEDMELLSAIRLKKSYVCRNQKEYDRLHTEHNQICRKLRKLKKSGKYHGDISYY